MNWRQTGDVSFQTWSNVITDAGGPAELASQAAYDAARPLSALILAMAGRECGWGTTENLNRLANKNVLNLKMPIRDDGTREPGFMAFTSWAQGIETARLRITSPTYGNGIYTPTVSIHNLISIFAPSIENDVQAYVDFIESHLGRWERVSPGGGGETTVSTRGRVPKPPMMLHHVRTVVGENCSATTNRARSIVGSCHHTSDGFFAGNQSVFSDPSWGGLTDYQVGGPWDGAMDGIIMEFIDPNLDVAPFANGEVGLQTAPYGDGPAFLAAFGLPAVNARLRSIETTDGAQSNRDKGGRQIESLCFLTAWIHSEQAGQSWDKLAWNMHHREFGVPHQGCPGAWIVNNVNVIQARAVEIMRAYQTNTALDMELLITYPAGWSGPPIQQPGHEVIVPATTPAPTVVPALVYPPGVDEILASDWFGSLTANGRNFSFNPNGSVSRVWLAYAATTGKFPSLRTYRKFDDGREYFGFEGGLVIAKLGKGQAPQVLGIGG